jgi:hypothetical protein
MKIEFGFKDESDECGEFYRIISNSKTITSEWYIGGGHFKKRSGFKFPMRLYKSIDWDLNNF